MSALPVRAPVPSVRPGVQRAPVRRAAALTPRLRVVAAPEQARARVPFVLFCIAIVSAALLGVLVLNTSLARGSFEQSHLRGELAKLSETQQSLSSRLDFAASPAQLAAAGLKLGMVPAPPEAFIRLSDSTVIGNPTPAVAGR
jgi:hypothetical protein